MSVANFVEPHVDRGLARLAKGQHAVFSVQQAVGLGLTRQGVSARARAGRFHRVHHGVYALVPPQLLTWKGRLMAAVLACGPGAAISHRTAADLQDVRRSSSPLIEVTVPTPGGRRRAGIRIHRSTTLRQSDVTLVDGIPCTTVARTLLDLADYVNRRGLERAIDQAEIKEVLDLRALEEQIAHNRTRPCARRLERVLKTHVAGSTATWNDIEEAMLAISRAAGLPDPEVQQYLDLGDGEPMIQPDFLWRDQRVIVETDGWGVHKTREAFENDRRRDQRSAVAGWRPLRFTWRQLKAERRRVTQTLLAVVPTASGADSSAQAA